jgi:hypothetical protein
LAVWSGCRIKPDDGFFFSRFALGDIGINNKNRFGRLFSSLTSVRWLYNEWCAIFVSL